MDVKVGGIKLNVWESGARNDRPTLLFLHYFGGSAASWREVIARLENDYYCVAPDLRGFGKSTVTANFEIENHARDVIDLTAALDLNDYVLIGHSMGGKIALAVAARKPENLRSLILFAPSPPSPEPMAEGERQKMLATHGARKAAEETIANGIWRRLSDDVFERAVEDNLASSEAAWKWWLETGSRRDISSLMEEIEVPIFAAVGAKDENITAELTKREIIARANVGELSIIENAKHLLPLEAPDETAQIIQKAVEVIVSSDNSGDNSGN